MMETLEILPRPLYLDRIMPYVGSGMIKVLTGQRRVGKSYILRAVEQELRGRQPDANFIHIDLEDFAFAHVTTPQALHDEIVGRIAEPNRQNYIFIDEVQEVEGFEKVIRSLNLNPLNDIYVTGSNSSMLSSEIGSRLAGRSIEFRIHPLSYSEFLDFHRLSDSDESLDLYLRYGGMPYLRNLPLRETWTEYLANVTDSIVYRDVVTRHQLRNNDFLQRLILYLADNIGQLFTAKRIADYLKSQHVSSTVTSVQTYVDYVCEAYVIDKVKRWNIKGRRLFEIGEKYYFEDLGIRNAVVGYRPMDIGGLMENAVYNRLVTDGYTVMVGVLERGGEIDFVAERGGEYRYIQVAVEVGNEDTARREFGNLETVPDNYDKLLVTLRDAAPNTHRGIRMLSLRQFLTCPPVPCP